jgi:hypothetical protein
LRRCDADGHDCLWCLVWYDHNNSPIDIGSLVISNSQFISNTEGAVNSAGALTVTNSLFRANSSAYAVLVTANGSASINNSQFISNTHGGLAVYAPASINNSQFYSDSIGAAGAGGGLYEEAHSKPVTLTVSNSQFMTNTAYTSAA